VTTLLEIDYVVSGYGRTTVLRGVSLTVAVGEIVALIGPNGAGKSTLLNTIMGLLPVTGETSDSTGVQLRGCPHRPLYVPGWGRCRNGGSCSVT
jgi:branched-chain amino acid transport system ATP-binding protein